MSLANSTRMCASNFILEYSNRVKLTWESHLQKHENLSRKSSEIITWKKSKIWVEKANSRMILFSPDDHFGKKIWFSQIDGWRQFCLISCPKNPPTRMNVDKIPKALTLGQMRRIGVPDIRIPKEYWQKNRSFKTFWRAVTHQFHFLINFR